jgi:voltage-gated potassium channel
VDVYPEIERWPGQPRSEHDAAFLKRYEARMQLPIIVAAILPLIIVPGPASLIDIVVGVATWLVFLVDYVVHRRHIYRYRRTGLGRFDLFVVVATAPWFLIPGLQVGEFVVLLRLARLARLVMASRGSRRLLDRLGRVTAIAIGIVLVASLVAYHAEHPVNPEFATVGDALWWGIVTLTTVGYGDIVPKTATGRWAAVVIMITGIAVLGVLAGSLSSFFRVGDNGDRSPGGEPAGPAATPNEAALATLTAEISALRLQVEFLTRRLTGTLPDQTSGEPPPGQDTSPTPGT